MLCPTAHFVSPPNWSLQVQSSEGKRFLPLGSLSAEEREERDDERKEREEGKGEPCGGGGDRGKRRVCLHQTKRRAERWREVKEDKEGGGGGRGRARMVGGIRKRIRMEEG